MMYLVGASAIGCEREDAPGVPEAGFRRVVAISRFDRERLVSQVIDQDGAVIATAVWDIRVRWGAVARPGGPRRVGFDPQLELSLAVSDHCTLWAPRHVDHVAGCRCGDCPPPR